MYFLALQLLKVLLISEKKKKKVLFKRTRVFEEHKCLLLI